MPNIDENENLLRFAREKSGMEALSVREALEWLATARDEMTKEMEYWRSLALVHGESAQSWNDRQAVDARARQSAGAGIKAHAGPVRDMSGHNTDGISPGR